MIIINKAKDALIIIDVLRDFCPANSIEWTEFEHIIPVINKLIPHFNLTFTTQDWHPERHVATKEGVILEHEEHGTSSADPHCVVKERGKSRHHNLLYLDKAFHLHKGEGPDKTYYSAFEDAELERRLKESGIERIFICGLHADGCIKETAQQALARGYEVVVIQDASVHLGEDKQRVFKALKEAGISVIDYKDIMIKQLEE